MPSGGARKNAGRKPKALADKLAAGNPGRRPLKKVTFDGFSGEISYQPPEYLRLMEKRDMRPGIPTPTEIFIETVRYIEPSECLNLVPVGLIVGYSVAKHHLLNLFSDSGTTMPIAAEQTGRVCDMMKPNPNPADVIVKRFKHQASDAELYLLRDGNKAAHKTFLR